MIEVVSIMIFIAFFTLFTAILYQGVKRVFPDGPTVFNLTIALSMAFPLASLIANSEMLNVLAYPFSVSSAEGIFVLILRGIGLLGVSIIAGLFVMLFIVASTQFFKRKIGEIKRDTHFPYPERAGGEVQTTRRFREQAQVEPEITEATQISAFNTLNHRSERRRPSDLILELDLTEENE